MDETKNSSEEIIDETESSKESLNSKDNDKKVKLELGTSFNEIPGTPIVENVKGMTMVPDIDKFSVDICEHKSYEMTNGTPTGSYQRIVNLTREFKSTADGQN